MIWLYNETASTIGLNINSFRTRTLQNLQHSYKAPIQKA